MNLINTVVGLLFPLVTFPYVSRVLQPDGIGVINFYSSIIKYIVLFSSLGIGLYGIREVAKIRNNYQLRNKETIEILGLHIFLSIIGYIVVILLCLTVKKIEANVFLFSILSLQILLSVIGVNWFYQGIEDFKYITIRSLIVKFISAILLFTLVKTKNDITTYAWIIIVSETGNNLFNFIRLGKYVNIKELKLSNINIFKHLIPSAKVFVLNIIVSLYISLAPILLGFLSTETAVGLYTTTTRINSAVLGIVTALGTTLLPRMSHYASTGQNEIFVQIEKKGINFILTIAFPIVIGLIIVSPELIPLFSGAKYMEAIPTMRIIAPAILFVSLSGILGMQVLYPLGKERIVIICTTIGAIVFLSSSFILIPKYSQNGAALSNALAEFSVLISMLFLGKKYISYSFNNKYWIQILFGSFIMGISVLIFQINVELNIILKFLIEVLIGILVYGIYLIILKNEFVYLIINMLKLKLNVRNEK